MTTLAPSAAPTHAIRVWQEGLDLFAEIPGDPPYVMRLSLTEAGLTKALRLLRTRYKAAPRGSYKLPQAPPGLPRPKQPAPTKASEEQRQAARAVLRKMGMI